MKKEPENKIQKNTASLERELQWFSAFIEARFETFFNGDQEDLIYLPKAPDLEKDDSNYAQLIKKYKFGEQERIVLCLAIAPNLKPQLLDLFLIINPQSNRPYTEFGGYTSRDHRGFLPTGETVLFLLSQGKLQQRVSILELFGSEHLFASENILHLERRDKKGPIQSGRLLINEYFFHLLLESKASSKETNNIFAANRITSNLDWQDMIVAPEVMEEILQIKTWIENKDGLMKDAVFSMHVKTGYRSLFYGPPGTGKTLAASLLGKAVGLAVYKVNFSLLLSKYIGETEKNLRRLFAKAENQGLILFFDEADALFGKRTQIKTSDNRYANQEVAYLLQRLEDFQGLVIFSASDLKNIDEAFLRRFQSIVHFPMPGSSERLKLWKNIFNGDIQPAASVDMEKLAEKFELSGGGIVNVLRNSTLKAIQNNKKEISNEDIIRSIRKEFRYMGGSE